MEPNRACYERKERIVLSAAAVCAGMDLRTSLADDNLACLHSLAAESLDAKALRVGIASVAG